MVRTTVASLTTFLEGNGVDLSIPHNDEIYAPAMHGAAQMTYGQARELGILDERGDETDTQPKTVAF